MENYRSSKVQLARINSAGHHRKAPEDRGGSQGISLPRTPLAQTGAQYYETAQTALKRSTRQTSQI